MKLPLYQVDAFTDKVFKGNPAAVCPLDSWLDDQTLQNISFENQLSETAFFVLTEKDYELRWFTPNMEVNLCGHATLASAHIIFTILNKSIDQITFHTQSGPLLVKKYNDLIEMNFPATPALPCEIPKRLVQGLGCAPVEVLKSRDYMAIYQSEDIIRQIAPDFQMLESLDALGVIITAPGKENDFVSRFFAPKAGVPEDPVTGSAHCTLVPYWSKKLDKLTLSAAQVSQRGGHLLCEYLDNRVKMAGRAITYLEGYMQI